MSLYRAFLRQAAIFYSYVFGPKKEKYTHTNYMSLYRVFLRQAAIFYSYVFLDQNKKKNHINIFSKRNCFRIRKTLNTREKHTIPITFTHQQTKGNGRKTSCVRGRRTVWALVQSLHMYCMNMKGTVTLHHPRNIGPGVWNVTCYHLCQYTAFGKSLRA